MINARIFREYDIRGVADRDLDDALVTDLGRAVAGRILTRTGGRALAARPRIAVGFDCRLTSPRLRDALVRGLREDADVIDVGMVATPVLYFAAHHLPVDGAVMITGSHNPAEDNGFKVLVGTDTIHGEAIAGLLHAIEEHRARGVAPPESRVLERRTPDSPGRRSSPSPDDRQERSDERPSAPAPHGASEVVDVLPDYLHAAASSLRMGERRFKIVVDAGHGAGGPAAVALYRRLGFEVVPLHCEPDGRFPAHHPDPTVPENLVDLQRAVAAHGAEVGLALDGDADRLGAIDGTGRILWGDQLMILFGRAILEEVPDAKFVGEVKCSQAMYDALPTAEMWKVGHSLIKARMKETGAALAGEMSGHLFFAHRWMGFDDAIYAGARLLELLSRGPRTLAQLAGELPAMVNTPEIRIDCPDDRKFDVVRAVTARLRARPDVTRVIDVDGVRASFDHGWGLVRASNTQPALVMRCEAATPARLEEIRAIIERELAEARR